MVCPQETGWIQTPTNHWNRKASEGDDKGRVIQVLERPHPLKKQTPKGAPPGAHPIQRPGPLARHSHQFDNLQVFIFCYWGIYPIELHCCLQDNHPEIQRRLKGGTNVRNRKLLKSVAV
jgi:hypothetical protein